MQAQSKFQFHISPRLLLLQLLQLSAYTMKPATSNIGLSIACFAPIVCAVHCSIVPLAVTLLSALSLQVPESNNKHQQHCHHNHLVKSGPATTSWMHSYVLPLSQSLGWAAQAYLFRRDRSARRLLIASFGLSLLSAKTVVSALFETPTTMEGNVLSSWRTFVRDHSTAINLVGSALLIGSSFIRPSMGIVSAKTVTNCCKKQL